MSEQWTNPDSLRAAPGEYGRSADFNAVLDNLKFLHDRPRVAVRLTSALPVNSQADTAILWSQRVWGWTGMWSLFASSRVVIEREGVYAVSLSTLWNDGASDGGRKRAAYLHVNGTRRRGFYSFPPSSPTEYTGTIYTSLAVGDYLEVQVRQDSGGELALQPSRTVLTVVWDGAYETGE